MKRNSSHERGYSLAEVLVALAVFALVIIAALMIYDRSNRTFKLGVEASNLQQNTRVAFDKLVADLRMTGFDFDRDGIPTGTTSAQTVYQQPDEQFEFIGPAAVTIRSNFDFEEEKSACAGVVTDNCDNGRERSFENLFFPVVTTGNDEIVTYALVPDSQATPPPCNPGTNCIEFFADTNKPRKSFADPTNGGVDESTVQIPGVDLCIGGCNNPPYTLYRFSLERDQQNFSTGLNVVRTPLATNIRSMAITYYQDPNGTVELMDLNNTVNHSTGAAILGKGKWAAGNPSALVAERNIRAKVNSLRLSLVGMTEVADPAYTDTAETVASARNFRKYRLDTLVAPRNILKRGMKEQDTFPPCAPTIVDVCTGACNGVFVRWTAPAVNAACGAPDQYQVIYDANVAGTSWDCDFNAYTNTFATVFETKPGCTLVSGNPYRMAVVALNSYGKSLPSNFVTVTPSNGTDPAAPTITSATTNLNGKVTLTWNRNPAFTGGFLCLPGTNSGAITSPGEVDGYIVERTDPFGNVVEVADKDDFGGTGDTVTFTDTTALNCVDYQYRVRTVEYCHAAPGMNASGNQDQGISDFSTPVLGKADAGGILPERPPDLHLDQTTSILSCGVPPSTCDVSLSWPQSTKDASGTPIAVGEYRVYRQEIAPSPGAWTQVAGSPQTSIPATGDVTFVDTGVPWTTGFEQYRYHVTAVQCGNLESAPSAERVFPCPVSTGLVNPAQPIFHNAFDGAGVASYPFLVVTDAVATVNITSPATLQRITGRIYNQAGGLLRQIDLNAPTFAAPAAPAYTFMWQVADDATERIDITVVDTSGCVEQFTAYYRDELQSCCLAPFSLGGVRVPYTPPVPIIVFTTGSTFIDIILHNECSEPLILDTLRIQWSSAIASLGGQRIDSVEFPNAAGGRLTPPVNTPNTNDFTVTVPAAAGAVAAGQQNYRIRVQFFKALNNPNQPFTLLDFRYHQPLAPLPLQDCQLID